MAPQHFGGCVRPGHHVDSEIESVRGALASEDAAEIGAKMEQLGQAAMKRGEAVYTDAENSDGKSEGMADMAGMAPGGDGPAADEDAPEPDNIVDAEFEELDDEDKNQRPD